MIDNNPPPAAREPPLHKGALVMFVLRGMSPLHKGALVMFVLRGMSPLHKGALVMFVLRGMLPLHKGALVMFVLRGMLPLHKGALVMFVLRGMSYGFENESPHKGAFFICAARQLLLLGIFFALSRAYTACDPILPGFHAHNRNDPAHCMHIMEKPPLCKKT